MKLVKEIAFNSTENQPITQNIVEFSHLRVVVDQALYKNQLLGQLPFDS